MSQCTGPVKKLPYGGEVDSHARKTRDSREWEMPRQGGQLSRSYSLPRQGKQGVADTAAKIRPPLLRKNSVREESDSAFSNSSTSIDHCLQEAGRNRWAPANGRDELGTGRYEPTRVSSPSSCVSLQTNGTCKSREHGDQELRRPVRINARVGIGRLYLA